MSGLIPRHGLSRNTKRLVFDALFARQGGRCAICGISQEAIIAKYRARYEDWYRYAEKLPEDSPHRQRMLEKYAEGPAPVHTKLHIDHCHWTGRIRGLLCESCNIRLGELENRAFREKPDDMPEEYFTDWCDHIARWLEEHWEALFQYMQRDRWLPTKDIRFHLRKEVN